MVLYNNDTNHTHHDANDNNDDNNSNGGDDDDKVGSDGGVCLVGGVKKTNICICS